MSKKSSSGIVYSTNPGFNQSDDSEEEEYPSAKDQTLHVHRETKGRGGKAVVIIKNLVANPDTFVELSKALKAHCGCGGSEKNGEILIQGDQREKVIDYLSAQGYRTKRVGG